MSQIVFFAYERQVICKAAAPSLLLPQKLTLTLTVTRSMLIVENSEVLDIGFAKN